LLALAVLPVLGWLAALVMPDLGAVALPVAHALLFGPAEQGLRSM
jgi:hypothetical protein